jgi:hypothetical protein
MRIGEAHAFAREAVNVRRGDLRLRIEAARVAVAHVVNEEEEDVWRSRK